MTEPVQAQTGPQGPNSDGGIAVMRAGKFGELNVSELQARYYEQNYRGNMFYAASQAVATTTVGLATTYTGLVLSNPVGSTKNLILCKASLMQSVIQSTQPEAFALATGFNATTNVTHTTPATPKSCIVGSTVAPVGLVDTAATLPTAPLYTHFLQNTASATVNGPGAFIDLEGSIILAPGAYACFVTPTQASVAGMWFSLSWMEILV